MIFGAEAPAYYKIGLPVIPLREMDKRPFMADWSRFSSILPSEQEQEEWISAYPDGNIGLVLGEKSNLVMIDIDTDNEELIKTITDQLPESPWIRIGAKGCMLAYRYNGTPTFRIADASGKTIVEHLSAKTQIVLPPSIHPKTLKPYYANKPLYEVVQECAHLPSNIEEKLRAALKVAGLELRSQTGRVNSTTFVAAGARDVTMIKLAGSRASSVLRGEITLARAIDDLVVWAQTRTERVAGDEVDINKGINSLLTFIQRDIKEKGKILPLGWDEGLDPAYKLDVTEEQAEWPFNKIRDYLRNVFETTSEDSELRIQAIDTALKHSNSLTAIDKGRLLTFIQSTSGMKIRMGDLKERAKQLKQGEVQGLDHTEIAEAVIRDLNDVQPVKFWRGQFMAYNGSHWEPMDEQLIMKTIAKNYGHLAAAKRSSDHSGIMKVMSNLIKENIRIIDTPGVNFANGYVTQDLQLVEHDHAFGMTYTLPFRYRPELAGAAFKFQTFLHDCWGKDPDYLDKMKALQEAMCATIFGLGPKFQRAILLFGAPKTGKSQLLTIMSSLVPDQAKAVCPPERWHEQFKITELVGKLLNVCGELPEKQKIRGNLFKGIISGEEQSTRNLYERSFTFAPVCTHWFASNHLPKSDDTSSGFARRWLILSFRHVVQEQQRVLDFGKQIVEEEREAIAAWAIEALPELLMRAEYTLPQSHSDIYLELLNTMNSCRHFLTTNKKVKVGVKGAETREIALFEAYWNFTLTNGSFRPLNSQMFRVEMRALSAEMDFKMTEGMPNEPVIFHGIQLEK